LGARTLLAAAPTSSFYTQLGLQAVANVAPGFVKQISSQNIMTEKIKPHIFVPPVLLLLFGASALVRRTSWCSGMFEKLRTETLKRPKKI
jgi:hypothetical protein